MNDKLLGFKELPKREQILTVVIMALSGIIFVLAVLQLVGIWEDSIIVYEPLMAVMMLFQAMLSWTRNRKMAMIYIVVAAILVVFAVLIFLAK